MKRFLILIVAVIDLIAVQGGFAFAEEELFDTKAASALFEKGMEHLQAKKLDQAINAFEESISVAPEANAFYFLGYTYYLKGKVGDIESRKKSIENFEKAYELNPNYTPTRNKPPDATETEKPTEKLEQKPVLEANPTAPSAAAVPVNQQKPQ